MVWECTTTEIKNRIKSANKHLGQALSANDTKWTKETDRAIELARQELMDIMELVGRIG